MNTHPKFNLGSCILWYSGECRWDLKYDSFTIKEDKAIYAELVLGRAKLMYSNQSVASWQDHPSPIIAFPVPGGPSKRHRWHSGQDASTSQILDSGLGDPKTVDFYAPRTPVPGILCSCFLYYLAQIAGSLERAKMWRLCWSLWTWLRSTAIWGDNDADLHNMRILRIKNHQRQSEQELCRCEVTVLPGQMYFRNIYVWCSFRFLTHQYVRCSSCGIEAPSHRPHGLFLEVTAELQAATPVPWHKRVTQQGACTSRRFGLQQRLHLYAAASATEIRIAAVALLAIPNTPVVTYLLSLWFLCITKPNKENNMLCVNNLAVSMQLTC